ncbi:helix-turn-helix domain-containing protein [Okeania hirsuta]|uniref:helix-turn-helix domain-containing protein n=1 Tax=Okeania hirsuta TaxID=1458930 RepID=UPI00195F7B3C
MTIPRAWKPETPSCEALKNLVEEKYKEWHASSSQYAEALHISPDYLNRSIKSLIGKTAKEYIQSRITTAAKRMLYFSELSNKEIGFELGFSEPANFSAFFQKVYRYFPLPIPQTGLRSDFHKSFTHSHILLRMNRRTL